MDAFVQLANGFGTALTESVASQTDVYAFLWRELGMKTPK